MENPTRARRPWRTAVLAAVALVVGLVPVFGFANPAGAADPVHVSFTLEGCRNPSVDLEANDFVCADGDYTSGNLGKTWNELDLVPHRLTVSVGAQSDATTEFDIAIAADRFDDVNFTSAPVYPGNGMPGYDLITLFTKKSGACTFSVTGGASAPTQFDTYSDGLGTQVDGIGGTDVTGYVKLHVSQPKNTTCVIDWVERLALGSHLYPGSSLHSNVALLTGAGITTSGIGARDVSIPVKEIAPQELDKDMSATQGANHLWSITKETSDASVSFNETCSVRGGPSSDTVQITVRWTKLGLQASGDITVLTHIYATNPAHRALDVSVVDVIYSGTTALHTFPPVTDSVAANSTELIATHQVNVPSGSTNLNDIATATYTDTVTGIAIPGTVTATASTGVSQGGAQDNLTAVITDVEEISGDHFSYSIDSTEAGSASGTFTVGSSPYVLGTDTTADITWTSGAQSSSGFVTFNKTITVDEPAISTGELADEARLTGSSGFRASANASIDLSSDATVSLTITKTIPVELATGQSASFDFEVRDSAGLVVATPNVTLGAGDDEGSVTVTGLDPGTYTVHELDDPFWDEPADQQVTITLPSCSGAVTMANALQDLSIDIDKSVNGASSATTHAGDTVTYDLVITNTGEVTLELTSLLDAVNGGPAATPGGTCAALIGTFLDPDDSASCTYSGAPTVDTTNVASVVGTDILDRTATDSDNASVNVITPGIAIVKTVNGADSVIVHEGDVLTYVLTITNTGDTALTLSDLDDVANGSGVDLPAACDSLVGSSLAALASVTCTYTAVAGAADVDNVATVTGDDVLGEEVSDDDAARVDVISPAIEVVKTASPDAFTGTTGTATFTYVVTNTGDTTLFDVVVTDDVLGAIGTAGELKAGASVTFTKTADVRDVQPRNVAVASGVDVLGKSVADDDDAVVSFRPEEVLGVVIELPRTGFTLIPLAITGLLFVFAGFAARRLGRKKG